MKKVISFICVFILVLSIEIPIYAGIGDVLGRCYATDIKTYLNGTQIDAINIGGDTLISAEDMQYYGFSVIWNPQERELIVDEITGVVGDVQPEVSPQEKPTGTPIGYYYETDIVTYLDNVSITAYNIGGRTYIHAEAMRDFGYLVDWYGDLRRLEITSPRQAGYVYEIPLSYGKNHGYGIDGGIGVDGRGVFSVIYTKDKITGVDDADYFDMKLYSTGKDYQFDIRFYQNDGLFNSVTLINSMKTLCHDGYGVEDPCTKEQLYDIVNQTVFISINGQKAEEISVTGGAGNGHRDFYFIAHDLPPLSQDEINEIVFTFGEPEGEPYEIVNLT